jgi:cytochrome P450
VDPRFELLLEGLVLAGAVWPAARVVAQPVVGREIRRHRPAALAGAAAAGLAALALLACAAVASAPLRRASVALVALGAALAAWRARPAYGAGSRLAPGSLGLRRSLEAIDRRELYLREAARHGPVFKSGQFGRPVLCVLGLGRGLELLTRHAHQLEAAALPYTRLIPKGAIRYMRREDHREVGGLFRASIAATDLAASEEAARQTFRAELLRLAAESAGRPPGVRVRDAAGRALFGVMARILLGIGPEGPEIDRLASWKDALAVDRFGARAWRRQFEEALDAITEALRRAARGPSPPSAASSSLGRMLAARPDALEDRTLAANLILIFRLSSADLTGLLDWIAKMLSDHPSWVARMRAEGRTEGAPSARPLDLGTRIVMETLRLEQSEYLYRKVTEPFEFAGYRVPKGWLIRICVQESHRSPAVFENPTHFDPDRFERRAFGRDEYAPLGLDGHACMGAAIVHFLGRIFVEELALGFEWDVVSDGPPERGTRHWQHWTPSSRFRIALRPRVPGAASPPAAVPA